MTIRLAVPLTLMWLFIVVQLASASVVIAPARIEIEVGSDVMTHTLTIVNRGGDHVWARAYAGEAIQRPDGSIRYLDDEKSVRAAGEYVMVDPGAVMIAPGSHGAIPVLFGPLGEQVSYYPVIFVELLPSALVAPFETDAHNMGGPVATLTRVAVPVLMTNSLTHPTERSFRPVLVDLGITPDSQSRALDISVRLKNDGNLHGEIAGMIALYEPSGRLIEQFPVRAGRILPGAIRDVTVRWPLPSALGQAFVFASVDEGGSIPSEMVRAVDPGPYLFVHWDQVGDSLRVSVAPSTGPQIQGASVAGHDFVDVAFESAGR